MKRVIHWFRRDLRLSDNTGLSEAARRAEEIIPVFILEDALRTGPDVGGARLAFLLQSLEALRRNLAELVSLSDEMVQQPWANSPALAKSRYPEHIVLHEEQRPKCLAMFGAVRKSPAI